MTPEDPRHGRSAGYVAGCRDQCCKDAIADWMRHYRTRLYLCRSDELLIDGTGTRRRIRALMALGWSSVTIDERVGRKRTYTANLVVRSGPIRRDTADAYARVYLDLHDQAPPENDRYAKQRATRLRGDARRKGWPTPDRWFDIDDPDDRPDPGYSERTTMSHAARKDTDEVIVERILAGDMSLANSTSRAEKVAVVARWSGSMKELERQTGWKTDRYRTERAA